MKTEKLLEMWVKPDRQETSDTSSEEAHIIWNTRLRALSRVSILDSAKGKSIEKKEIQNRAINYHLFVDVKEATERDLGWDLKDVRSHKLPLNPLLN